MYRRFTLMLLAFSLVASFVAAADAAGEVSPDGDVAEHLLADARDQGRDGSRGPQLLERVERHEPRRPVGVRERGDESLERSTAHALGPAPQRSVA